MNNLILKNKEIQDNIEIFDNVIQTFIKNNEFTKVNKDIMNIFLWNCIDISDINY